MTTDRRVKPVMINKEARYASSPISTHPLILSPGAARPQHHIFIFPSSAPTFIFPGEESSPFVKRKKKKTKKTNRGRGRGGDVYPGDFDTFHTGCFSVQQFSLESRAGVHATANAHFNGPLTIPSSSLRSGIQPIEQHACQSPFPIPTPTTLPRKSFSPQIKHDPQPLISNAKPLSATISTPLAPWRRILWSIWVAGERG